MRFGEGKMAFETTALRLIERAGDQIQVASGTSVSSVSVVWVGEAWYGPGRNGTSVDHHGVTSKREANWMRALATWISVPAAIVCASACSTTSVTRVTGDHDAKGLRYWLAAPYVLVSAPVEVSRTEHVYRLEGDVLTLVPPGKWLPGDSAGMLPLGPPVATPAVVPPVTVAPPPMPVVPGGKGGDKAKQKKAGAAKESKDAEDGTTLVEDKAKDGSDPKDGAGATAKADKGSAPASVISIVWLPDYCEQYAVSQSNTLSAASMKIALADGWKFVNFDASNDSSAAIGKLLDTVATVAGKAVDASKDVRVATIQKDAAAIKAGSTAGAQATKGPLLRRTISSSLKPGIYPLFERPADKEGKINCDATPHLSAALSGAVITTMESWTELPLSRPEQ
jgi:hypothetical protein